VFIRTVWHGHRARSTTLNRRRFSTVVLPFLFLAVLGFLVMGYHPGAEDDGIYLTGVKADLNPALFPHDAAFFQLQMRTTVFGTWMAYFVRGTGMPLPWAELLWQLFAVALVVWSCWSIIRQLFDEAAARWAGVAMVAAMFTLPVAGTALYIMDQYLHPRNPATALILLAVARILAGKAWQAAPLLVVAFLLHPLMGAMGISFCIVLTLTLFEPLHAWLRDLCKRRVPRAAAPVGAMIPFAWIFDPPSHTWLVAMRTRHLYHLFEWTWYEWLGAIGPLVLFWLAARLARRRGEIKLAHVCLAILLYGVFQQIVALILLSPLAPVGFATLEPMRYLHLVYIFLALLGGAYLGRYVLKAHIWRWGIVLLLANGGMFVAQRQLFAGTSHIELPSMATGNPWLQAFDWIRQNTPQDAYFAVDPNYTSSPGEDYHCFRPLAERSMLADANKDASTVTKEPELGPAWALQSEARKGWAHFQLADFERLKAQFGVDWVLVSYPQPEGLSCRWHNQSLAVCQIP
jgi:hypothetical protein